MNRVTSEADAVLTLQGLKALDEALGAAGTHRFLTLAQSSPADYVKFSRKLYAGQTVKEIYARARARQRSR